MGGARSPPCAQAVTIRYTGARVKRLEDPRLLRGRGRYLDDVVLPRLLAVAFVRSPHAHARVRAIDAAAAGAAEGVVAVVSGAELRETAGPLAPRLTGGGFTPTAWPPMADGEVRFAGEAVAAVVATTPYLAADARELVRVDYEPRPAVAGVDDALAGGHVLFRREGRRGDVAGAFAAAAVVLRERFTHGRLAAAPMEPRGVLA